MSYDKNLSLKENLKLGLIWFEDFCNENMMRNYHRNRTLIDLDYIPKEIGKCIQTFIDTP